MLPIHDALPGLLQALQTGRSAVLVAPPGAGKTTVVPLELLKADWLAGQRILMLEPRRLAARAAASRMASLLGEPVGETVGYRVRLEARVSARTRIEVVTEGVFTRRLISDPELAGVGMVIFDEFHERSLDADLGLALARESQSLLRDDLRLLVMSATLDGAAVGRLLDSAPVIESLGRVYPVETRYLGKPQTGRLEAHVAGAVERALAEQAGGVLVFLPGQAEIRRTAELLNDRLAGRDIDVAPLYGAMEPSAQDRAIAPSVAGRRKVVLATSIAETSLTIEDVRAVVDCGLARTPRYDPASGLSRLATVRVSRAAADQRRGRAGRLGPGLCYRLWDEPETRALAAFATPEILEADLSGLALSLAAWGARDPAGLAFLDPPPQPAFGEARALLESLDALDPDGVLTPHGARMADFPLPPRLAHMVLRAAAEGQAVMAARIAAILSERGLGGRDTDLVGRLEAFSREAHPKARQARQMADRWARLAGGGHEKGSLSVGMVLAFAYPERIARARGRLGEFQLANGRGAFMEATEPLARSRWLVAAELGGAERRDRILLAAALDEAELLTAMGGRMRRERELEEDAQGRLKARTLTRLGRLVVREELDDTPDGALVAEALLQRVRRQGLGGLAWPETTRAFRDRAAFLRQYGDAEAPDLSDAALIERLEEWLEPLLGSVRSLGAIRGQDLDGAVRALVPWDVAQAMERAAPSHWTAPTGSRFAIDYAADGGPRVDVRVQEVFGLTEHPCIAHGRVPLTLALLSPAHRPIQMTRDLPGFWKGSWKDVRSDMRGRYPRHVWPDDPATAAPTQRAKPRGT